MAIGSVPATTINFLQNIPMPMDYSSTLWFTSLAAQRTFFYNYPNKRVYENCTYQRSSGYTRVQMEAGDGFKYNYMYYQNPDSGQYFYCFITDVRYVNNNCVEFLFTIDILQTFMLDLEFKPCMIDREHVNSDVRGEHTEREPFTGLGQYLYQCVMSPWVGDPNIPSYPQEIATYNSDSMMIAVAHTFKWQDLNWVPSYSIATLDPGINNRIFSGVYITLWKPDADGLQDLKNMVEAVTEENKIDGILSIYMTPYGVYFQAIEGTNRGSDFYVDVPMTNLGLYTPKNNKLYTYPYCFCFATNNEGNAAQYKYEYFESYQQHYGRVFFTMAGQLTLNPALALVPRNYEGSLYNYNAMLTTSSFPTCAWDTDLFKAYIAQNSGRIAAQRERLSLTTAFSLAEDAVSGFSKMYSAYQTEGASVGEAAIGAAFKVGGTLLNSYLGKAGMDAQMADISTQPPQANGNDSSTLTATMGVKGFELYKCYINSESAAIVDNYFSLYGYHIGRVKQPNLTGRQNWNFVKCNGAVITGKAPASVLQNICQIFNNGITLWHNISTYGDYSQSNPIVSGG